VTVEHDTEPNCTATTECNTAAFLQGAGASTCCGRDNGGSFCFSGQATVQVRVSTDAIETRRMDELKIGNQGLLFWPRVSTTLRSCCRDCQQPQRGRGHRDGPVTRGNSASQCSQLHPLPGRFSWGTTTKLLPGPMFDWPEEGQQERAKAPTSGDFYLLLDLVPCKAKRV